MDNLNFDIMMLGENAFFDKKSIDDNPYSKETHELEYFQWNLGYYDAEYTDRTFNKKSL